MRQERELCRQCHDPQRAIRPSKLTCALSGGVYGGRSITSREEWAAFTKDLKPLVEQAYPELQDNAREHAISSQYVVEWPISGSKTVQTYLRYTLSYFSSEFLP